jgi:hypothetical protein
MNIIKEISKFIVVVKIFITYGGFIYLMTWFNWFISTKLIKINFSTIFNDLYYFHQYSLFLILQWIYFSLLIGIIVGIIHGFKRNKDFFIK